MRRRRVCKKLGKFLKQHRDCLSALAACGATLVYQPDGNPLEFAKIYAPLFVVMKSTLGLLSMGLESNYASRIEGGVYRLRDLADRFYRFYYDRCSKTNSLMCRLIFPEAG